MELPPSAHAPPRSPGPCDEGGRGSAAPCIEEGGEKSKLSGREQHHLSLGGCGTSAVRVREGTKNIPSREAKLVFFFFFWFRTAASKYQENIKKN